MKKRSEFTPEQFYGYGTQKLKNVEIADLIGKNTIGLSQLLRFNPDLKDALEKGRKGFPLHGDLGFTEPETREDEVHVLELKEKIISAISGGAVFLADIAERAEAERAEIYRILCEMINEKAVLRTVGDKTSYHLPNAEKEAVPEIVEDMPLTPLSYRGLSNREKVEKAILESNHLTKQICAATGLSVDEVIVEIEREDSKIIARPELTFTAFFVEKNVPADTDKLVWKDGKIEVVKMETKASAEVWDLKQRELAEKNAAQTRTGIQIPETKKIEVADTGTEQIKIENKMENKQHGKTKLKYTPEMLEGFGREGLTVTEIEKRQKLAKNTIHSLLYRRPDLKKAYRRGFEEFNAANDEKIKYSASVFENFGREGLNQKQLSERLGRDQTTISKILARNKEFAEAYGRGKAFYEKNVSSEKRTAFSREVKAEYGKQTKVPNIHFDAGEFERFAFEGMTLKEIGASVGVPFKEIFKNQPALRDAYMRGAVRRFGEIGFGTNERRFDEMKREVFKDDLEALKTFNNWEKDYRAHASKVPKQIHDFRTLPEETGPIDSESAVLPKVHESPVIEISGRFEHLIEHLTEKGHSGDLREKFAQKINVPKMTPIGKELTKMPDDASREENVPQHLKALQFERGGKLVVASDVNIFEAPKKVRDLLGKVADALQEYENE